MFILQASYRKRLKRPEIKISGTTSTRQINRILQNEDLGHMLLVSSDPYISSLKKISKMNLKSFDEDIRALLIVEGDKNSDSDSDSDKDDDSE
jgi:hypothetical protein